MLVVNRVICRVSLHFFLNPKNKHHYRHSQKHFIDENYIFIDKILKFVKCAPHI
jgi:hypothetical protein